MVTRRHPQQTTNTKAALMTVEEKWLYGWMFYSANENDIVGSGLSDMYNFYSAVFSKWCHSRFTDATNFVLAKMKELPESPDTLERIQKFFYFINQSEYDTYFLKEHESLIKQALILRGIMPDDKKFVALNQIPNPIKQTIRVLDFNSLMQWLIDTPIKKDILLRNFT